MNRYLIGDLLVEMDYGGMLVEREGNLSLFRQEGPWDGEVIRFRGRFETEEKGTKLRTDGFYLQSSDNGVYERYQNQEESWLIYHWGNLYHGFEIQPDKFCAVYNGKMKHQPSLKEDWFFSITAFHKQLLMRNSCILHSSYCAVDGQAFLFTGPSNIGKSTQAALWKEHVEAEIINGDRTLLREKDGVWYAYGYPCCGTSQICVNKTYPLGAVVVLEQSSENRIVPMSVGEKIRYLTAAMELYPWDLKEIDWALSVAQNIAMKVPVIKFCCRPDRDAVNLLKNYLEEHVYGKNI